MGGCKNYATSQMASETQYGVHADDVSLPDKCANICIREAQSCMGFEIRDVGGTVKCIMWHELCDMDDERDFSKHIRGQYSVQTLYTNYIIIASCVVAVLLIAAYCLRKKKTKKRGIQKPKEDVGGFYPLLPMTYPMSPVPQPTYTMNYGYNPVATAPMMYR